MQEQPRKLYVKRVLRGSVADFEVVFSEIGGHVATVSFGNIDEKEAEAYARLFAASPRLLASCKRLAHVAVWDEDTDRKEFDAAMRDAEAAIADAESH